MLLMMSEIFTQQKREQLKNKNEDSFVCAANDLADLATASQLMSGEVAKQALKRHLRYSQLHLQV